MKNISAEVSIFCPWTNWIHLVTCSKIEFRDLHCYSRWTKSLKFTLSIAVHGGGLAKNHFWLVATQKKRIGEQLNYFWNMCPKPFSWAKNKRKLFSDGKSRGPLLARVALKTREHPPPSIYWIHSTASYRECRTPTLLPRFSVSSMSCFRAKIIHKLTIFNFTYVL